MPLNSLNPGYVWMPYIPVQTVSVISAGFTPSSVTSRYAVRGFWPKNHKRMRSIKNILNEKTLD